MTLHSMNLFGVHILIETHKHSQQFNYHNMEIDAVGDGKMKVIEVRMYGYSENLREW